MPVERSPSAIVACRCARRSGPRAVYVLPSTRLVQQRLKPCLEGSLDHFRGSSRVPKYEQNWM